MKKNNYAYSETLEILENMDEIYVNKIPSKIIKFLKDNSDSNYEKHIIPFMDLKTQNLDEKTLAILAMLDKKYWSKTKKEEKSEIKDNDDIFKKRKEKITNTEEWSMVEQKKDNIFTNIIKWFKGKK